MPYVRLKGLNRVATRGRDGRPVVYWYAWKGGPRLEGEPGTAAFIDAYNRAVAARRAPARDDLRGLVVKYKSSPEWARNAPSTKAEWSRWLDKIMDTDGVVAIGELPLAALDDRRVRAELLAWRDQFAATPRSADYAMQVLSRVLNFGVDRGLLAINAAAGVKALYTVDRADQIWTAADLARFIAAAPSPEVAFIVQLACLTGLRREDLVRLQWSHVGDLAIVMATGKSRGKRTVTVPMIDDTRALLARIREQTDSRREAACAQAMRKGRPAAPAPLTVLTNTRGRWASRRSRTGSCRGR